MAALAAKRDRRAAGGNGESVRGRSHDSVHQKPLQFTPRVADDVNAVGTAPLLVNDSVHAGQNLPVLDDAQVFEFGG